MPPKSLVAAACLLLAGGAAFVCFGGTGNEPPPNAPPPASPPRVAPTQIEEAAAARTNAVEPSADASRPIPDDAEWIQLLVVDKVTHAPVTGATVRWLDESSRRYAEERRVMARHDRWLADDEDIADVGGWRTSTDVEGRARIAVASTTTVLAEHDGRFGELLLRAHAAPPAGGHRIELDADREVRVQVVDASGVPCGGVLVRLFGGGDERVAHTNESDGVARFRHVQRLRDAAEWFVKAVVLGHDDHWTPFAPAMPRTEPIVLRLPPCGSVRARAELDGRMADILPWIVFEYRRDNTVFTRVIAVGADGYAHLRLVPLGLDLAAYQPPFGQVQFAGPREAGQRVDVHITRVPGRPAWTGRLLTSERVPVVDQDFTVLVPHAHLGARTDAEGRFVVSMGHMSAGGSVDSIRFEWQPTDETELRAELAPRTLRAGIEDLGDVVATTLPLVAGGRITGLDAHSLRRVGLRVERHEPTGSEPERWNRVEDLLIDKRSDGAFTIRGTTEPGRHRLVAGGDVLPIAPIEFAVGRDDLSIAFDAGHDFAAAVLLPRDVPPALIVVDLVPPPSLPMEPQRRERLVAAPVQQHGERHDVLWKAIPAGSYTLEVRPWAASTPVLRVPDVHVPPPTGGDPRLADIDVRSLVRRVTIDVVDADGAPIRYWSPVVFPEPRPASGAWRGYDEDASGPSTVTLVLPPGPWDAAVCCEHQRPQHVRGGASDHLTVRLDPWPTVRVTFADAPPPRDDIVYFVRATPDAAVDGNFATPRRTDKLAVLLEPQRHWQMVDDGVAEPCVGNGGSRLEIRVYRVSSGREHVIPVHEPRIVLPTTSRVVARVPPEAWRQAIDAVTAPPK